jgi:hypothetical protein
MIFGVYRNLVIKLIKIFLDERDIFESKCVLDRATKHGYRTGVQNGEKHHFQRGFDIGFKEGRQIGEIFGIFIAECCMLCNDHTPIDDFFVVELKTLVPLLYIDSKNLNDGVIQKLDLLFAEKNIEVKLLWIRLKCETLLL